MRTEADTMAGLACHARSRRYMLECDGCAYNRPDVRSCTEAVHKDAMALIGRLMAEREVLLAELAPMCICEMCRHEKQEAPQACELADFDCRTCPEADCPCRECGAKKSGWAWKGVE